jgi:hypothetical protein
MRQADLAGEADQLQRGRTTARDIRRHLRNTTDTRAAVLTVQHICNGVRDSPNLRATGVLRVERVALKLKRA